MSAPGGLYVIVDPEACMGRSPVDVARMALEGGASMLQWRDKAREKGLQLDDVRGILRECTARGVPLIINDHADLALVLAASARRVPGAGSAGRPAAGLVGVHVGQKDLPVADVRRIVPAGFVVGASTNNVEEARRAEADGATYVAVGDIFGTMTKRWTRGASPQRLAEVKAAVSVPVFGIGGINSGNVREVMAAGADGVAVISAVCGARDPRAAAAELSSLIAHQRRT
ncbi:MAG TPA: thiamine phosphate synthase [Dehalococcoidia bacterium]|nr:thiamine phosphate synthase [Dehalococcoidia bacterium]